MTILNPYRAAGLFSAASFLLSAAGTAHAQERVTTYWDGARSGMFEDESAWTFGFPNNTADTLWDAVIDATGSPYTVRFESDFGTPDIVLQTLTLDSTDATLEIDERHYGNINIAEAFNFNAGTLLLKNAALRGINPNTRMNIGEDAQFDFRTSGSSSHTNLINNFDVYGGDLVIHSTAQLDLTDTHIKEGALVYHTSTGGNHITIESNIDFDIRIENPSTRRTEIITHVDGLEIAEGVTISGTDFYLSPQGSGWPDYLPASFINKGTIRIEGGGSQIISTQNLGLVDVVGGDLRYASNNEGTIRVHEGAALTTHVTNNGTDIHFTNSGLIEVSGPGSYLEITGNFSADNPDKEVWTNSGLISVSDHALVRFGSLNLSGLGNFERDSTSRIEITGRFNLGGSTIDSNTFGGDLHLTYDNPGGSGGYRGEITNGTIDLSGDWLKFSDYHGYISNVEFTGGDLLVDVEPGGTQYTKVIFDDITIRNGGLVLGQNGHIGFGEQYYDDGISFFNSRLSTLSTSTQMNVRLHGGDLHLGAAAFVTGHMRFIGLHPARIIRNEGFIVSTEDSGRLTFNPTVENYGVIGSSDNTITTFQTLNNYGFLRLDDAYVSMQSMTNNSTITLIDLSTLVLSQDLVLHEGSELNIEAVDYRSSINVEQSLTLAGTLNLDLNRIEKAGVYRLLNAEIFIGDFSSINITNLLDNLEFAGFDATTGTYSIVPSPSSFFALSLGVISRTRRKRAE
ncbi:MAG: hypothetical protein ACSHX5_00760 [Phycisphaerales bacterium]